ncbi:MAG: hypothetical protein H0T62_09620 [Parachlamydiaceae bacterium]|nr:hypothetical protein [Parachlamydiaceae bacterium]
MNLVSNRSTTVYTTRVETPQETKKFMENWNNYQTALKKHETALEMRDTALEMRDTAVKMGQAADVKIATGIAMGKEARTSINTSQANINTSQANINTSQNKLEDLQAGKRLCILDNLEKSNALLSRKFSMVSSLEGGVIKENFLKELNRLISEGDLLKKETQFAVSLEDVSKKFRPFIAEVNDLSKKIGTI